MQSANFMLNWRLFSVLLVFVTVSSHVWGGTLQDITKRGKLRCGYNGKMPGFGYEDPKDGRITGIDADFCRAVAVAVLGDATAIEWVPLTTKDRFDALTTAKVDLLARNTTVSLERVTKTKLLATAPVFYDSGAAMTWKRFGVKQIADLSGAWICAKANTTTQLAMAFRLQEQKVAAKMRLSSTLEQTIDQFRRGRCMVVVSDRHALLAAQVQWKDLAKAELTPWEFSNEPLALFVRQDDLGWYHVVLSVVNALILAEELGINSETVDRPTGSDHRVDDLISNKTGFGPAVGLKAGFARKMIQTVGNYGEVFERNLGKGSVFKLDRGQNRLTRHGGLIQSIPLR